MIRIIRQAERRHVQSDHLSIWHSFQAQTHPDAAADSFGTLLAFDELQLAPGSSTEPHFGEEAQIITYVFKGALSQEASTGNSGVLQAGEFQRMSAGNRIRHKETNASPTDWVHAFRIFLRPSVAGLDCSLEGKLFTAAQRRNTLCVIVSPDGRKGSLRIHQDAFVYSSILDTGHHLVHPVLPGRAVWLHLVTGEATLKDIVLTRGDSAGVTQEPSISLTVMEKTELLLIDLVGPLGPEQTTTTSAKG